MFFKMCKTKRLTCVQLLGGTRSRTTKILGLLMVVSIECFLICFGCVCVCFLINQLSFSSVFKYKIMNIWSQVASVCFQVVRGNSIVLLESLDRVV